MMTSGSLPMSQACLISKTFSVWFSAANRSSVLIHCFSSIIRWLKSCGGPLNSCEHRLSRQNGCLKELNVPVGS